MGRIMSFGQDGQLARDFDKSEHDFLRRYGRTPDEVMTENARLRELLRDAIYARDDADWASIVSEAIALGVEVE